jgi:hypothetical protein
MQKIQVSDLGTMTVKKKCPFPLCRGPVHLTGVQRWVGQPVLYELECLKCHTQFKDVQALVWDGAPKTNPNENEDKPIAAGHDDIVEIIEAAKTVLDYQGCEGHVGYNEAFDRLQSAIDAAKAEPTREADDGLCPCCGDDDCDCIQKGGVR